MFGGIMLAVASLISLYWGLVGLDSTLHGFDWALLTVSGLISFGFGLVGAVMSMRRKQQALAIFAVCLPLIVNLVAVKSALDGYQLAIPWVTIVIAPCCFYSEWTFDFKLRRTIPLNSFIIESRIVCSRWLMTREALLPS